MDLHPLITPANVVAAILALAPYLVAAFLPQRLRVGIRGLPAWLQLACPVLLSLPYVLVTCFAGDFRWGWFALYAALPVAVAALLRQARRADISNRGAWQDYLVLAVLGLAVDLRWFEAAWPPHLAIFNKILLLDAGIYGFVLLRDLEGTGTEGTAPGGSGPEGTGFDLRLRWRDLAIGLREVVFYTPIALALGLGLGFLHWHGGWPGLETMAFAWIFTFFFIAVPEELFFRGWLQNLLERRIGRTAALLLTSVLFGLAHFNKRAVHFNWRYVLLAAVAGFFYGRAWRQQRRVAASAVTHASVDAIWSLWLK